MKTNSLSYDTLDSGTSGRFFIALIPTTTGHVLARNTEWKEANKLDERRHTRLSLWTMISEKPLSEDAVCRWEFSSCVQQTNASGCPTKFREAKPVTLWFARLRLPELLFKGGEKIVSVRF
eukprot:5525068-Amphidinium_carterae.1